MIILSYLQKKLALELNLAEEKLSSIYVSLARTYSDCEEYPQAFRYYKKELKLCGDNLIKVGEKVKKHAYIDIVATCSCK